MGQIQTRFFAALAICIGSFPAVADWEQFRGDASHTGYAEGVYDPTQVDLLWDVPRSDIVGLAVREGEVYLSQWRFGFSGSVPVSRLDAATGAEVWTTGVPYKSSSGVSAPSLYGQTVYVHRFGHSGSSGNTEPEDKPSLVGLDAHAGGQLFSTEHRGQWSSGSRPTVQGDAVFAAGGYYGGLDAYELDGTTSWNNTTVRQQYGWVPAADDDHVYTYMGRAGASPGPSVGTFYILDRDTGVTTPVLHPRSVGTRSRGSDDGSVMLDGLGNAYALSQVDGSRTLVSFDIAGQSIRWEADGLWIDNPALRDGMIALPERQSLVFLDATTGARIWDWQPTGEITGSVILTDTLAFVNTTTGVHAIDLTTRQSVWNTEQRGDLVADDGFLYVFDDTSLTAYRFVPEPSSLTLLGLMGLALVRRRR